MYFLKGQQNIPEELTACAPRRNPVESQALQNVTKEVTTMKKFLAAAGCALLLSTSLPVSAAPVPTLTINGADYTTQSMATVWSNTTYVSLRAVSTALDSSAVVSWEDGIARVETERLSLTAQPGEDYIRINEEQVPVPLGVKVSQGRTLIPVRTLARAFDASVFWDPNTGEVSVTSSGSDQTEDHDADAVYWLSRIISAESRGEPLEGKIAVGNVVLNRVASPDFPSTIYGVIFDDRWGGQFEPVRNGTIYHTPTEESVLAAQLCLEGHNVVGDSLYFLAPALAQNFWTVENREYVTTIGCHDFYR